MNQQIARNEFLLKRLSEMDENELTDIVQKWRTERDNYIPTKKKKQSRPKKSALETVSVKKLLSNLTDEQKAELLKKLDN